MTDAPNIVLIMTDQQRADFTRREGFALDTTPFIDTLGRSGALQTLDAWFAGKAPSWQPHQERPPGLPHGERHFATRK